MTVRPSALKHAAARAAFKMPAGVGVAVLAAAFLAWVFER